MATQQHIEFRAKQKAHERFAAFCDNPEKDSHRNAFYGTLRGPHRTASRSGGLKQGRGQMACPIFQNALLGRATTETQC